ncbi:hypothetical protein [Caballeronia sp. Lep1P3]|uniref:hypothetical protein n=1 Tax=Caballeronia sp. Lep1P3 TaxID=2878150 RepID=UPI001FD28DE8|nr:hypothetical protein [Caballeronia sp. Lep1P3]
MDKNPAIGDSACVQARRVYYVSGFDPRGPGYYHRLYREEAVRQAALLGVAIKTGPRTRKNQYASVWHVDANWEGRSVSTEYQFLHWDDIVRNNWERNLAKLVLNSLVSFFQFAQCGAWAQLRRDFRGPFLSAIYPHACLVLIMLFSFVAGFVAAGLVARLSGHGALGVACGFVTAAALCIGGVRLADRSAVFWLLRIYDFVGAWNEEKQRQVEARAGELARHILDEQGRAPCDEVLIIGHSVGSIVAVMVGARLSTLARAGEHTNLSVLTLGQCIPLLGMQPSAERFRACLRTLADHREFQWLDMNARADALAFSQVNPLDASGVTGALIGRPVAQVVRPFRMFHDATWKKIQRDKMRLHFQYLMASELPNQYDYFRMTAGPNRLEPY